MNSQKRFAGWFTAALIGAAAVAAAPHLFGGGGDEGVDILPFTSVGPSLLPLPPRPQLGYITVERAPGITLDGLAHWQNSGVIFSPHALSDVFVGHIGHEPWVGKTSIDVVAKGTKHLSFANEPGGVHVDGRYEMTDVDPNDGETVTLVGHLFSPALAIVIVGVRGTTGGPIMSSFIQVDRIEVAPLPMAQVDLKYLRDQAKLGLAGTGRDVAIGIVLPGSSKKPISSWAAFNVDDSAALYDVDTHGD